MVTVPKAGGSVDGRPKMLLLLFTDLGMEPRALRQIRRFATEYRVTTVGRGGLRPGVTEHIELDEIAIVPVLWRKVLYAIYLVASQLRWYRLAYWANPLHRNLRRKLREELWDVVIAHDVMTLPLAAAIPARRGFAADMHEFAPRQYENRPEWVRQVAPLHDWLCRNYLSASAFPFTVGPGLARAYSERYDVDMQVVMSATDYADLQPGPTKSVVRCVHSGSALPGRRIEVMIDAVLSTEAAVTLDLYLVPTDPEYVARLKQRAAGDPRVTFVDPVPYSQLVSTLNNYDLGLSIIGATTFNHYWSVPNKFFDYVQARLGLVVGPSPDMASLVNRHGLGAVLGDFESDTLAAFLNALEPSDVELWKSGSHRSASALSGEREMETLAASLSALPVRGT